MANPHCGGGGLEGRPGVIPPDSRLSLVLTSLLFSAALAILGADPAYESASVADHVWRAVKLQLFFACAQLCFYRRSFRSWLMVALGVEELHQLLTTAAVTLGQHAVRASGMGQAAFTAVVGFLALAYFYVVHVVWPWGDLRAFLFMCAYDGPQRRQPGTRAPSW